MMVDNKVRILGLPIAIWTRSISCLFAAGLFLVWRTREIAPSLLWWGGNAFIFLVGEVVEFAIPQRLAAHSRRLSDLKGFRTVLQKERKNFQQIRDAQETGRTFSDLHQKAVEVYSFDNTRDVFDGLWAYRRYRKQTRIGLRQIADNQGKPLREMDVVALLQTIDKVLYRLDAELK